MTNSEPLEKSFNSNDKNITSSCSDINQLSGATLSTLSTRSSGVSCRICQDSRVPEALLTPCHCTGTIAYVHSSCLEKWLSQTARKTCELCKFEFRTIMKMKGLRQWICASDITRNQRRYMFADSSCFMLLTPLGLISGWLCIKGAQQYYSYNDFWTGFGLNVLTGFLTLLYLFWFGITLRYHYKTFRNWQRKHAEVRLVFDKTDSESSKTDGAKRNVNNEEEVSAVGFLRTDCFDPSVEHVVRIGSNTREEIRLV